MRYNECPDDLDALLEEFSPKLNEWNKCYALSLEDKIFKRKSKEILKEKFNNNKKEKKQHLQWSTTESEQQLIIKIQREEAEFSNSTMKSYIRLQT